MVCRLDKFIEPYDVCPGRPQRPATVIGAKTAKKHENNRGEGEGVGVRGLFEKDAVFCLDFAE